MEQDAAKKSAPEKALPDRYPRQELAIAKSVAEETLKVGDVSVAAQARSKNIGRCRGKAKYVVRERELRISTMAKRPNGIKKTRSGKIRHDRRE